MTLLGNIPLISSSNFAPGFHFIFFQKDVVSHSKKMKSKKSKSSKDDLTGGEKLGIKGLSKGKRRKLEAYQHLFYLLQVINFIFYSFFGSLNTYKIICRD